MKFIITTIALLSLGFIPVAEAATEQQNKMVTCNKDATGKKGDERKAQTLNEKSLEFSKRQLEREESRVKQEKAEAEAKERAQRCEQAQAYVRNLQAGGRATRLDPKTGERIFLDEKEREVELADARRSADSWCKPPAPAGASANQPG